MHTSAGAGRSVQRTRRCRDARGHSACCFLADIQTDPIDKRLIIMNPDLSANYLALTSVASDDFILCMRNAMNGKMRDMPASYRKKRVRG